MRERSILISATVQNLLHLDDAFATREGFNLLVASDTADLFSTARAQKPDIIFITPLDSDAHTAEKCCAKRLKDDPALKGIPTVAVVDGDNKSQRDQCKVHKPDDILFTPLNTHLFLATTRRILGLPHRTFDRIQTSMRIQFGPNRNSLRPACAYNLSTGGIYIATESKAKLNSRVIVRLDLPQVDRQIFCESVVSWINNNIAPEQPEIPAGIGLQFLSLNANDLFAIRNFINRYPQSL